MRKLPGHGLGRRTTKAASSSSWGAFLEGIEAARASLGLGPTQECFYRGHSNAAWPLLPTLLRYDLNGAQLRSIESDMFFEFKAHARELHDKHLSGWDILFYMRHCGVPTRLLDWTDTFAIAVYFACDIEIAGRDGCVWMLNPYALNESGWDGDLVAPKFLGWDADEDDYYDYDELLVEPPPSPCAWETPVAIYPDKNNPRLFAQRGYFTIHGKNLDPIETQVSNKTLRKVPLPKEAVDEARRFLVAAGIHEYHVYGDLDSLARMLKRKYLG